MKIVYWNSGEVWGDPNLRWGNPSYLLEPGDPGYVPPISTPVNPNTQRSKKVKRNIYFPIRTADQVTWLNNFCNKIAGHAAALGLTAGQISAVQADCKWLAYVLLTWLPAVRAWSLSCTDAATEAQTGPGTGLMDLPVFTPPALTGGTVAVNTGALNRLFAVVQLIKDSGKATEAISSDLGIIGSEKTGPDMNTIQPTIKARVIAGGVEIPWGWGGNGAFLDMIQLQVDRNDNKGFVDLAYDTTPGYTDTAPQPATPTKWTYKAIYRVGDHQVGLWSNPVSVIVPG